ncbi:MAG: 4Fe-4S binding protein [Candidatus Marinimicrobia bacterium]|nr:4Fe-4S binding protein [Candidatus Neomarinimicrobiota bacterium]
MKLPHPIYTEKTECQDCYKCLRQCPVKAIKIIDGNAEIIPERCILCGHCVETCPVEAKKIRDDLALLDHILSSSNKTFASIAPSFVSEFSEVHYSELIRALKEIGFDEVSETALGAQEVSVHIGNRLDVVEKQIIKISSACPTIVRYICKYKPQYISFLSTLYSPLMAHAKLLRQDFGEDIKIVFIGPCVSKKQEVADNPDLVDAAITFSELKKYFDRKNVRLKKGVCLEEFRFVPEMAEAGSLYPIDGGMIAGIKANCSLKDPLYMALTGIDQIKKSINDLENFKTDKSIFLELLACSGGCINGPGTTRHISTVEKRFQVVSNRDYKPENRPGKPRINISTSYQNQPIVDEYFSDIETAEILRSVGKYHQSDELNCGGCGYDTCRDFAAAMLAGKAEKTMCVSYTKQLAQKKANALMKTMPSGVVIVNADLKIVDCNRNFATLFGEETVMIYEANPGMEGAALEKIVSYYPLFKNILESGNELIDKEIAYNNAVHNISLFNIEKHHVIGCIIQDITVPSIQKSVIIKKTRNVIEKNLTTVQKIAYLLGENASETEVILSSILKSFDHGAKDE